MKNRWFKNHFFPIRKKLMIIYLATTIFIFFTNLYMYSDINKMIAKIDHIYHSNAELTDLKNTLDQVQDSMMEYLNSKSSDSMEEYYKTEQNFTAMLDTLNQMTYDDSSKIMEKNIYNMSKEYISLTGQAVEAKRGRNVERYKEIYEQSEHINEYINTYLYSLNNIQFKSNTTNYEKMLVSLNYAETINVVMLLLVGAVNILLIIMVTTRITTPLRELSESANEVAKGNLDIKLVTNDSRDEVEILTGAFNQMVVSLKQHILRLKESIEKENELKERELLMETHLKDAKLKYLQAQINPHFLFNTLNAGAQLAMMEGAPKTYTYVQNVADFYRYNVKNDHEITTLLEEISLVDTYIYILNVRFSGEIKYHKDIDESLLSIKIPSMILQPIVENCVNHGLKNISWEKEIYLTVEKEDKIYISISDNGIGMTKDQECGF